MRMANGRPYDVLHSMSKKYFLRLRTPFRDRRLQESAINDVDVGVNEVFCESGLHHEDTSLRYARRKPGRPID